MQHKILKSISRNSQIRCKGTIFFSIYQIILRVFCPNLCILHNIWKKNMCFLSKSILFAPHLEEKPINPTHRKRNLFQKSLVSECYPFRRVENVLLTCTRSGTVACRVGSQSHVSHLRQSRYRCHKRGCQNRNREGKDIRKRPPCTPYPDRSA